MIRRILNPGRRQGPWILLVLGIVLGCAPEPNYEQQRAQLLERFTYLSQINALEEAEAVLERLAEIPGGEAEAAYGGVLLQASHSLTPVANVFASVQTAFQSETLGLAPSGEQFSLTRLVHEIAREVKDAAVVLQQRIEATTERYPDASINLDGFYVYAGPLPTFIISSEIDATDLLFLAAITNLTLELVSDAILSQQFGITLPGLRDMFEWVQANDNCVPSFWHRVCYLAFISWMVDRFPSFLTLSEDGVYRSQLVLADFHDTFEFFLRAVAAGVEETDDQSTDYITVLPPGASNNPAVSDDEYELSFKNVGSGFEHWTPRNFSEGVVNDRILFETQPEAFASFITLSKEALESLRTLADHMADGTGRLELQQAARPFVEVIVALLGATSLTNVVGSALGLEDSIDNSLAASGVDLADAVMAGLRELIPEGLVELDLYGAMTAPTDFRDMLLHNDYVVPGKGVRVLAVEWECDWDLAILGECVVTPQDGPRFVGYPYEMAADGIAEDSLYMALIDPTLNGALYLDVSRVPTTTVTYTLNGVPAGSRPATNRSLNFVFHRIWDYVYTVFFD